MEILAKVDSLRVSDAYQKLYSRQDSQEYFNLVTEELYHQVLTAITGFRGHKAAVALEELQSIRAKAHKEGDAKLQSFLSKLIHVRYDQAWPCPLSLNDKMPPIPVHFLHSDGTVEALDLAQYSRRAGTGALVLFAGSWT
mmetsp:Transcript_18550/g.35005  ORF Transcript_18550/g.35005 Transcript_18550/m.35005 type:complete len:140 (-) Transcript_18550:608-1027(-)